MKCDCGEDPIDDFSTICLICYEEWRNEDEV